jgi:hypothetical protein
MPYKDPEAKKEYDRQWNIKNKEKRKEYKKIYRQENKEKIKEYSQLYHQEHKEELKEKQKLYVLEHKGERRLYRQTPNGIKSNIISQWRSRGVLDHFNDNFETLYKIYQSTKFCDDCGYELNTGDDRFRKCLDHEHTSGYFRGVVCHSCNVKRA